jgi:hypothetical protein
MSEGQGSATVLAAVKRWGFAMLTSAEAIASEERNVPKPDPLDEWFDSLPMETKHKVEAMLARQERVLLRVMVDCLLAIKEGYREGWDDLDEALTIMIETYETNLPTR